MQVFNRNLGPLPQGDITIIAVDAVPKGEEIRPKHGQIIVGHSETGHHHSIAENGTAARLIRGENPFVCYLVVDGEYADLVHHRQVNPHETVRLPKGCYQINRQREWSPEGWRQIQD